MIIGGLYVLVQQASPMKLAESHSDVDRQAQEVVRLQGRAEQSLERLAAGISSTSMVRRPHESTRVDAPPTPVQLLLQSIFVSKTIQGLQGGMLCSRQHGQHGAVSVGVATDLAEDAFAVLPQDLEVHSICEQSKMDSTAALQRERLTNAG